MAETGLSISRLALYPDQVNILNNGAHQAFLLGPPGSGKTLVLYLRARQWLQEGKKVQLVGICQQSRAVSALLEQQLRIKPAGGRVAKGRLFRRQFDFYNKAEDVTDAVNKLASTANACVIVDEVGETVR